jgi:ribose transport system substrate-binding protein
VAFSQITNDNPFRSAETASMKAEAEARGWKITVTDAGGKEDKQIADMKTLISQKPDAIFLAPNTEKGLAPVVKQAAQAGIAVFLIDRTVDPAIAKPGTDFVTTIASDFIQEGKRAAIQMAKATNGQAQIIELEGTTGSSPAIDRKKGFTDAIAACPGMKVIASQDADFARDKGQQVYETLAQSNPNHNAVYAHNDEMALGAINAIKAAGKTPGQDVKLVSIDGNKDAVTRWPPVSCSPASSATRGSARSPTTRWRPTPAASPCRSRSSARTGSSTRATPSRTSSRPTEARAGVATWTQFDPWTRWPLPPARPLSACS